MLACVQLAPDQDLQALFSWAVFWPLWAQPVALPGVVVIHVQDVALVLVELHTIGLCPLIQPAQIPQQSLPTLQQIHIPSYPGWGHLQTEGTLNPLVQVVDKDVKQDWPLGNTTCDQLPAGFHSIQCHSLGYE